MGDTMPLEETENEIRARVKRPGDFIDGSFRRKDLGDGISIIIGKLENGDGSMITQAYRFDKTEGWTIAKARAWLKEKDIILLADDMPYTLIMDGIAPVEIIANNASPYDGASNKFYVEGEAIRPGTYQAANLPFPVNYPINIMNTIAEQLEGQPIRYWHSMMGKVTNKDLNKIGVVTDTKVTSDNRVLWHGFITKNQYQAFMGALVEEAHIDPKEIPSFSEFVKLIQNRTLGGSSVGLKVDGIWEGGAYTATNPRTNELSIVPKGACPTAYTRISNRWGILALNSAKTPDGKDYLIEKVKSQENVSNNASDIPEQDETTKVDPIEILAGLARAGADGVDISRASEEELMAIIHFVDAFKTMAFSRIYKDKEGKEVNNAGGEERWLITTKNQTVRKVVLK